MKKITAFTAAVTIFVLSFCMFGCKNKDEKKEPVTSFVFTEPEYTWPDDSYYFKDIPAPSKKIKYNNSLSNDKGRSWQFDIEKMSYKDFRQYILTLEKKSFVPYSPSSSVGVDTALLLPEKLREGAEFASWSGFNGQMYVSANWYSEDYLKEIGGDVAARFSFSNYIPFSNNSNEEEPTK